MKPTVGTWVKHISEERIGQIEKITNETVEIHYPYDVENVPVEDMGGYEEVNPIMYILEKLKDMEENISEIDEKYEKEIDEIGTILRTNDIKNNSW